MKKKDQTQSTSIATEFLLQQAFTRRGLALDRVGILDFDVHERVIRQFFHMCTRPTPAGYDKPTTWHIVKADREMWAIVFGECRNGCKPTAAGARPLDALVRDAANNHLVIIFSCCPSRPVDAPSSARQSPTTDPGRGRERRAKAKTRTAAAGPSHIVKAKATKAKVRPKTMQTSQARGARPCPKSSASTSRSTNKGADAATAGTLDEGCHLPTSGHPPECERGQHVCMACGATDHGATSCPRQPKA